MTTRIGPPAKILRFLLALPVPWVFVLGYLAGVAVQLALFPQLLPPASGFIPAGGALLFVIGAGLAAWGWLIFRAAGTTRVPGEASSALVTWGPYRFTRNPMYVGLTLAYVGEAGLLQQLCPLFVLPLVLAYVNWVVIPVEEARLREIFDVAYDEYRSRVRRWL